MNECSETVTELFAFSRKPDDCNNVLLLTSLSSGQKKRHGTSAYNLCSRVTGQTGPSIHCSTAHAKNIPMVVGSHVSFTKRTRHLLTK